MKNPWFKFYPTDWRSHAKLRNCGPAARGLWIEMLCLMHEASPYGHLLINGEMPTITQLSMQAAIPESQVPDLLGELEKSGVFSRNGKGVIYSRKMVRDEKKSRTAEKNGKNGGNPSLCSNGDKNPLDNPPHNPPDKGQDKPQKPEAKYQKLDKGRYPVSGEPFEGQIIKLDFNSFNSLFQKYSFNGDEQKFRKWLSERDNWYTTQPYKTYMNDKWIAQTVQCLERNKTKGANGSFKRIG